MSDMACDIFQFGGYLPTSERSVVQVEAVNVNSGLHSRPWV